MTFAVEDGQVIGRSDVQEQTKCISDIIRSSLEASVGSLENAIRIRIHVNNITQWENVGRAHREFFRDVSPAMSMVEVSSLIEKDCLVEIEASEIMQLRTNSARRLSHWL